MDTIRQWFLEREDGEFSVPPGSHPFSLIPPISESEPFIYTTKPSVVSVLYDQCEQKTNFGVIGRYGLPSDRDVEWLNSILCGQPCCFVGDADPPDLLVFAWLRSRIGIRFRGVNDDLLDSSGVNVIDRMMIELTNAERDAMLLVHQLLPDFDDLLGQQCGSVLESGRKIELEVVLSFATVQPEAIVDSIVG